MLPGALALVVAMLGCTSSAGAFSALGLRNALENCLNRNVSSAERIEACNEVIHTNVLLPRDRAKVITSRGNAQFASGNPDGALDDYNTAIGLNSGFQPAVVNRAVTLVRLGKCGQAIPDPGAVLASDSRSWRALYGRSLCEGQTGDVARAQSDLVAATAINPGAAQDYAPLEIAPWFQ
jgi:tetratricopeptide (TPR) repeat protein